MDDKRFPPPGNEVGYREAAPPAHQPDLEPELHEEAIARRHVVASRPDEPELALQKAATEDIARRQDARIARAEAWRRRARPVVILLYGGLFVVYVVARLWRC